MLAYFLEKPKRLEPIRIIFPPPWRSSTTVDVHHPGYVHEMGKSWFQLSIIWKSQDSWDFKQRTFLDARFSSEILPKWRKLLGITDCRTCKPETFHTQISRSSEEFDRVATMSWHNGNRQMVAVIVHNLKMETFRGENDLHFTALSETTFSERF